MKQYCTSKTVLLSLTAFAAGLLTALGLRPPAKVQMPNVFKYSGNGMALCQIADDAGQRGDWATLEFRELESLGLNAFDLTLLDGSKRVVFAPCLVNFDRIRF